MDTGFFDTLRSFKITSRKHRIADDDFMDRFNHYHTAILISVLSIVICAKQYIVGEPMQCWVPKEFTGGWEKYAEDYCWVKNTYYVHHDAALPDHPDRSKTEIKYYQWVPFVLGLQALMFNVPRIFWQMLNWQSGIHLKSLMEKANAPENVNPDKRNESLAVLTRHIMNGVFYAKEKKIGIAVRIKRMVFKVICCGNDQAGSFLLTCYLGSKLLYLANIVCQFFLMNAFLGTSHSFFGFDLLQDLYKGKSWEDNAHFPRVTYCDFKIRSMGQVRPYTIQCVLVINLFNEKVYIFLWFWFAFLLLATACNVISWIGWMIFSGRRSRVIKKVLKRQTTNKDEIKEFMGDLQTDGMFVLKMIGINSGQIFVHDLIRKLFEKHRENHKMPPPSDKVPHVPMSEPTGWTPPSKHKSAAV